MRCMILIAVLAAFLFANVDAKRRVNFYRPPQQPQIDRRTSEVSTVEVTSGSGDLLESIGWTAAGIALIGATFALLKDPLQEQLARQIEPLISPAERQLQQEEQGALSGYVQELVGNSLDSCWQLAICDAHARYDDHYKVVALPLTLYYSGSKSEPKSPFNEAAISGKAREDCNKKYTCLVNPLFVANYVLSLFFGEP